MVVYKVKCRDQKVIAQPTMQAKINSSLYNLKQFLLSNVIILHYTFLINFFLVIERNTEELFIGVTL